MGIIEEAFEGLGQGNPLDYSFLLKYSGKFRGYNANVRISGKRLSFGLSRNWRQVGKDIRIGLIQELLCRVLGISRTTMNIEIYRIFLKKVHLAVPKENIDPFLGESFDRVNDKYFSGMIEKPNLVWGHKSFSKFGSYDYGADTISISQVLEKHINLLDYVMYHEMLHKKHKFTNSKSRTLHHTAEFRKSEREFENSAEMERQLGRISAKRRLASFFGF